MGASIGSFGTPRPPAELTFEWFGEEIRVHPDVSDTVEGDFMEKAVAMDREATELDEQLQAEGLSDDEKAKLKARGSELVGASATIVKDLVRDCIHPDDFDRYWQLGRLHRQERNDHMAVVKGIVAAVGKGRGPSSGDSSSTPSATVGESEVDYLRRVTRGRPDLEAGIVTQINERRLEQLRRTG